MTDRSTGTRSAVGVTQGAGLLLVLLAGSLVVQAVVLYAPQGPGESPFPFSDKVVHLLVFAVPTALALLAGLRAPLVVGLLAAHAVLSEVVQGVLIPDRSGDPLDAVADIVGIGIGVAVVALSRKGRGAPTH